MEPHLGAPHKHQRDITCAATNRSRWFVAARSVFSWISFYSCPSPSSYSGYHMNEAVALALALLPFLSPCVGGVDNYILNTHKDKLDSEAGMRLKKLLQRTSRAKAAIAGVSAGGASSTAAGAPSLSGAAQAADVQLR